MKKSLLYLAAFSALVSTSCTKEEPTQSAGFVPVDSMSEMKADKNFNWSASDKGSISVSFDNPKNVSLDQEYVQLRSTKGQVLAQQVVQNGLASFQVKLAQNEPYVLYFPTTGDAMAIEGTGNFTFNLEGKAQRSGNRSSSQPTNLQGCLTCNTSANNNGFETPSISNNSYTFIHENNVPEWETTASHNAIEFWNNYSGVSAQEGSQFLEINAHTFTTVYKNLCLAPGSTVKWSIWHRGRAGVDVAHVKIGATVNSATLQKVMTTGNTQWKYYTGHYTVPQGQTNTVIAFEAITTAGSQSVGNFIDNFQVVCDNDGDGVPDAYDDKPFDPTISQVSNYPTSGKEVVVFEDLWPSMGDYDFNDLVLSNQGEIARNANNELVSATFKVSIDAIGAGLHNGIGLLLRNQNGQLMGTNMVNSVSGDISVDPDNVNGFILSNDVFQSISKYYKNNGNGPTETPDTLEFTLNFNPGQTISFIPELYLFRSNNRGLEVHRPQFSGSAVFDQNLAYTLDDNGGFVTESGLPWAFDLVTTQTFAHPLEKIDIIDAYPQFQLWVYSGGTQNTAWHTLPDVTKVFQ